MKQSTARRRSWRRCLGLAPALLLLLSSGCSKSAELSAYPDAASASAPAELPPAPVYDPSLPSGGGAYDFERDLAGGEMMQERSVLGATHSRARADYREQLESPPARDAKGRANDEAKAQSARAEGGDQGEQAGEPRDDPPDHGRQIIYTAGLQVSVFDLETAMGAVERLPDQYGGWVHMRNQSQLVLRLPAAALKLAMTQIAKLGVVEARTLQAQDVTAEYVDLESRITVLRETQTQLLELLGKAKTVEEALHVRRALDDVTMQLETALGRMRQLSDLIAFSTLTVTLVERGPQDRVPTSNDPFRWVDSLGVEATEWR